jgi:hypothetical protein
VTARRFERLADNLTVSAHGKAIEGIETIRGHAAIEAGWAW